VVENRRIMSAKYPLHFWLKLTHAAVAPSLCDSWASYNFIFRYWNAMQIYWLSNGILAMQSTEITTMLWYLVVRLLGILF